MLSEIQQPVLKMQKFIKILGFAFITCFFINASVTAAQAADAPAAKTEVKQLNKDSSPEDVVNVFYTQLLATMKNGDELGFKGRYEKLAPMLTATFDFETMIKLAVGSAWANASKSEQQALTAAFTDFSVANYASRFTSSPDGSFAIGEVKKSGENILVDSTLEPVKGESVPLSYLMHKDASGQFKVIDVLMGGMISELASKRSEFSAIIKNMGISGLVDMLNEKVTEMKNS